ncbi:MAG TPA: preprotein translocase subunit YajC [Candidatus Nanopelagicales bacterium]|nr:preprotein translocase subunit YajC [Candidatus Nanopelagicales bacterium]
MASSYGFQPTAAPQGAPAAPVEGQPAAPPAGQEAPPAGGLGGGLPMLLMFALPLLLIFMMTRSQNKKQKQIESSLKSGDRVITQAGLIGKIVDISATSTRVKLEIAPGVNVTVLKSAIQGVDGGEASAEAKDKAPEKK